MAAEDGAPPQHLTYFASIAQRARHFGLFAAVRGGEARAETLPRVGQSRLPSQNIVDLTQTPSLSFPGSTLDAVELKGGRAKMSGFWLGLTGPMGPLPLHLTEFASYERRYAKKRPFNGFLDLITGRMLQFFYRAWADSSPVVQADRPADDRFGAYVSALSGASEGATPDSAFPARARAYYASLFASRRSAVAIEDAMTDLLGTQVTLLEFQPRWRDIEPGDRTRLGAGFNGLGTDAVLGARVHGVSDAFRVVVRAANLREYESFLPTGQKFKVAAEALDAFSPSHLEWDIELELDEKEARPVRLDGRSRLGWTGWMAPKGTSGPRAEAHLGRAAQRMSRTKQKVGGVTA